MVHWCTCVRVYTFALVFDSERFNIPEEQAERIVENEPDMNDALTRCFCFNVTEHALEILREHLKDEDLARLRGKLGRIEDKLGYRG